MESAIIEVKPVKTEGIEKAAAAIDECLERVVQVDVVSQDTYEKAATFLKEIKEKAKTIELERKKITGPIDAAKAAVQALFKRPQEVLAEAERVLKDKMLAYTEAQEKKRREEQERLERIAAEDRRKKEEQERAWREKEEAKRREAEKLAAEGKADEARKAQEDADKAAAKADERAFESQNIAAPIAAPKVDKVAGVSCRDEWFAEVTDFAALPDEYKLPDLVKLNKQAKATKDSVKVPGVVFKSKKVLASR